jgi:exopolyphosphatase/pppGpp-phosphohydrolase
MHDFKAKMKAVSRRISHLRSRIDEGQASPKSASYDKAEVSALSDLLRVAAVYNDARGPDGSHVENTLYMTRDVLADTLTVANLDEDTKQKLQTTWEKVNESIRVIRKLADDAEKDS